MGTAFEEFLNFFPPLSRKLWMEQNEYKWPSEISLLVSVGDLVFHFSPRMGAQTTLSLFLLP